MNKKQMGLVIFTIWSFISLVIAVFATNEQVYYVGGQILYGLLIVTLAVGCLLILILTVWGFVEFYQALDS